jgi:hypothetical protein
MYIWAIGLILFWPFGLMFFCPFDQVPSYTFTNLAICPIVFLPVCLFGKARYEVIADVHLRIWIIGHLGRWAVG